MHLSHSRLTLVAIAILAASACSSSTPVFGDGWGGWGGEGASTSSSGTGASTSSSSSGTGASTSSSSSSSGTGGDEGCSSADECPGADTTCHYRTCKAGVCGTADAPAKTPCSENKGKLCDGEGSCVGCLGPADCAATESCIEQKCKPKKGHGEACKTDGDCLSGLCINDSCCGDSVDEDHDQDGFTAAEGDCHDCDAATNPGAIDVVNTDGNGQPVPDAEQVDEDCSGKPLLPAADVSCDDDASLVLDSTDPQHAVKAIDLCQTQKGDAWGVLEAKYLQIDGKALPATQAADLGHGIVDGFGPKVAVPRGKKMLLLSTGTARRPADPGFAELTGGDKSYQSGYPSGVPFTSQTCPNQQTGSPHDTISLQVKLRVPTNATELAFDVKFYTTEFPQYVCSNFNDIFLARLTPPPPSSSPANTNNITFDSKGEPLSVNNVLLDVCTAQTAGNKYFACPAGTSELEGTGFETHAGTTWLVTKAPVDGGSTVTVDFGIMDAADGLYSSSVLVDHVRFAATQGKLVTP
jgi:hypothetical protein